MAHKHLSKDEIKSLDLVTAEHFAQGLAWDRDPNIRYQNTGFPDWFANARVRSRLQYLIIRLRLSPQNKWNPADADTESVLGELAVRMEKLRAEKAAKDAAKKAAEKKRREQWGTTDKVTVKPSIYVELHDHRINGHTFILERKNGKITASQKRGKASAGETNCGAAEDFDAQKFQDLITTACTAELPEIPKALTQGGFKVTITAELSLVGTQGNQIDVHRKGNIVGIHTRRYGTTRAFDELADRDWQFHKDDLLKVIELVNSSYDVVPRKEEASQTKA